ncbi:MAG: hypothetical protein CMM02_08325 [Rhodopirellula sp.]|nr:hypothetical protein [Rhodopirellula sp.]|tara:strand:+ start:14968 stop:16092 length:1125 start_codon:yes stop_codon:yes gene_type:complete
MANETPVHIVTRQTAVNTATTNKTATSSNKGAALTNSEMDMNFLNTKKSIDTLSAQYYIAHNEDGTIKPAYIAGTTHYVEDTSTNANQLAVAIGGLTSLTAGLQLLVKVKTLNTGSSTITVSNSATSPPTVLGGGAKGIFKSKDVGLVAGELKADEIVNLVFDGTQFQVLNEGEEILDNQTVGSLITFDSTGKAVVVAPGTTGQVLTATTTSPPAFVTPSTGFVEVDLGTILGDNWKRATHGLKVNGVNTAPKILNMYFECINGHRSGMAWNHGYSVGDRIYYSSMDQGGSDKTAGPFLFADAVYAGCGIRNSGHFEFPNKWGLLHNTDGTLSASAPDASTLSGSITAGDDDGEGMHNYEHVDQDFKVVLQVSL